MYTDNRSSPFSRLLALPMGSVTLNDGFWAQRQQTVREVSLRHAYLKLEQSGNFENFKLAMGSATGDYHLPLFMDSDVYKWLEAVALDLGNQPDAELERMADEVIDLLAAAQMPDGYLNSYYQVVKPDQRWTNLANDHEMYCAGHLIQAAVAHHRATGKTSLLHVACRFADHIDSIFGTGKRAGTCGHPEIEMAVVELYRETRDTRYLSLAKFLIDQRGQKQMGGGWPSSHEYFQDHLPVRENFEATGHAVRQLYLASGVTDLYMETGEQPLLEAMQALWLDATARKMHLTGGYGARHELESFGDAYELPADRCYCETCAAIAAMMWNWRMLLATGDARHADLLERSLYNNFLSGISLDGTRYFYVNPLLSRGGIERPEWYGCACCPPNVMRQVAGIGAYIATWDARGVQIHQYIAADLKIGQSADPIQLHLETGYPWDGTSRVHIDHTPPAPWQLSLRIPLWCQQARLFVNETEVEAPLFSGSYARIERKWQNNDIVELRMPIQPRLTRPNPRVDGTRGCLAIERGPLVYCLETIDQPENTNILDVTIDPNLPLRDIWRTELLGGVMVVEAHGMQADNSPWTDELYITANTVQDNFMPLRLNAVPYYAWANRGPHAMRVWIPKWEAAS